MSRVKGVGRGEVKTYGYLVTIEHWHGNIPDKDDIADLIRSFYFRQGSAVVEVEALGEIDCYEDEEGEVIG